MTTNRLAKSAVEEVRSSRTALEWARSARERGLPQIEAQWIAEAKRRGEIPDHSEPHSATG